MQSWGSWDLNTVSVTKWAMSALFLTCDIGLFMFYFLHYYNVLTLGVFPQGTMTENWPRGNKRDWPSATKPTETIIWISEWIRISSTCTHFMPSPSKHTRECVCRQEWGKWIANHKLKYRLFAGLESHICIQVRIAGDSRFCSHKQKEEQTVASPFAFWHSEHSLGWLQTTPCFISWN